MFGQFSGFHDAGKLLVFKSQREKKTLFRQEADNVKESKYI
jgi:hypothetical protein